MKAELFNLFWWDAQGKRHQELQFVTAEKLEAPITRLIAHTAIVKKILITDTMDCTNFLWENGKLVYPTKRELEEFAQEKNDHL